MNLKHWSVGLALAAAVLAAAPAPSADPPDAGKPAPDKALAKLAQLVGGTWVGTGPKLAVEFRYEWAFGGSVIRSTGVIDKGGPHETLVEATLGWDPARKVVYYLDIHGGQSVFHGTVRPEGDELHFEFTTLVGPPAKWRSVATFPDKDTYQATILGEKDGKWVQVAKVELKRRPPAKDRQVTEGVIDATPEAVWAALTTKEGLEAWNVAHAQVELKVGGRMLTHYDPKGKIGDPNTIENIILSFEPERMLSIRVGTPPATFPFKTAVRDVWTVIRLEPDGAGRTRLTLTGLGYGPDEESRKLREFFEKGNAYTLRKLQGHFAPKK